MKHLSKNYLVLCYLLVFAVFNLPFSLTYTPPIQTNVFVWDFVGAGSASIDFQNNADNWVYSGFTSGSKLYLCDITTTNPLFFAGGTGIITSTTGYLERTYAGLASHDIVYYTVMFVLIGSWQPSDSFTIQIDSNTPKTYNPSAYTSQFFSTTCGSSNTAGHMGYIVGKKFHSPSTVTVRISFSIRSSISFAIKDLVMTFTTHQGSDAGGDSYYFISSTSDSVSTGCGHRTYKDSSGNCQPCGSACFLCSGPSNAQCYRPDWRGSFDGSTFSYPSDWNCVFGDPNHSGKCLVCITGTVLDTDGTCKASCTSPSVKLSEGAAGYCSTACSSGTYRQFDGTCSSSCNSPLTIVTNSQEKACTTPCGESVNQFLNYDGTCIQSCQYHTVNNNNNRICLPCANSAQYAYANGTCLSSCQVGFTPSTAYGYKFCDYQCPVGKYIYLNGSCLTPCYSVFNVRIEGGSYYFCDFPCTIGQFLYENKTCLSTCQVNFAQRIEGSYKFCNYPCSTGSYLYANGSCLSTCQSLFIPRVEGTFKFCDYPCSTGQSLYANGSCLSTCQSLFIPRVEGTFKFCDYPCSTGEKLYANGSCLSTCQPLFIPRVEGTFKFCDYPCSTGLSLYANGSCLSTCQSLFIPRVEGTFKFCDYPCSTGLKLYANGSCLSTCQSLFIPRVEGLFQFCDYPCSTGQNLYANGSCLSTCQSLFIPRVEGTFKFCDYPCLAGKFLYTNGSCLSPCYDNFNQRTEGTNKFCDYPCVNANDYLYQNKSCIGACQVEFLTRIEGNFRFCDYPCASGEYLYSNGSCLSACNPLFNIRIEGTYQFCDYPCNLNQFLYQNKSCSNYCQVNFDQFSQSIYQFCNYPCASNQYLYSNKSCFSTCYPTFNIRIEGNLKFQFCDYPCAPGQFLYQNKTCISSCLPVFNKRIEGTYQFCDYPCAMNEYLYQNKTCRGYCTFPFAKRIESIFQFCDFSCGTMGVDYYYPDQGRCKVGCAYPYRADATVLCDLDLSSDDINQCDMISNATDALDRSLTIGAIFASLISANDPGAFGLVGLAKMIFYTKYMELKYPPKLQKVINEQIVNKTSLEIIGTYRDKVQSKIKKYPVPEKFQQYWLHSSFLINFWQNFIYTSLLLLIILVVWILALCTKSCRRTNEVLRKIRDTLKWNFFFTYMLSNYDQIIVYTSLDVRTNKLTSPGLVWSLASLLIMNIIIFIIFITTAVIIRRIRKDVDFGQRRIFSHVNELIRTMKPYEAVFSTFKNSCWSQHTFFFIYSFRISIFYIAIGYMFDNPLAQAVILLIVNIASLLHLCIKRPLSLKVKLVQYITQESLLLIVSTGVFIVAILDFKEQTSAGLRRVIGDIILIVNLLFKFMGIIFILIQLYTGLKLAYQQRKINIRRANVQKRAISVPRIDQSSLSANNSCLKAPTIPNSMFDQSTIFEQSSNFGQSIPGVNLINGIKIPGLQLNKCSDKLEAINLHPDVSQTKDKKRKDGKSDKNGKDFEEDKDVVGERQLNDLSYISPIRDDNLLRGRRDSDTMKEASKMRRIKRRKYKNPEIHEANLRIELANEIKKKDNELKLHGENSEITINDV